MTLPILYALSGGAGFLFVLGGYFLFAKGWPSYEEKYLLATQSSLESLYITMPILQIVYLSFACSFVVVLIFGVLWGAWILAAVLGIAALAVPNVTLVVLKKRRLTLFGSQLVDALDNTSNALKAGLSVPQAFEQIQREMPNPISQEFAVVNRDLRLGLSMEEALLRLLERMPTEDTDLVVTAVLISREMGGNLTEILEQMATTIRDRFRIEGKIKSATSQGKMQGLIVAALPLAMGAVLNVINPEYVRPLISTVPGYLCILLIIVLEVLGYLWIRKIVTIDI